MPLVHLFARYQTLAGSPIPCWITTTQLGGNPSHSTVVHTTSAALFAAGDLHSQSYLDFKNIVMLFLDLEALRDLVALLLGFW